MRPGKRTAIFGLICAGVFACGGGAVIAGSHTWDIVEIFSNADGTIQFVRLMEVNGGTYETGVGGHFLTSNTTSFQIPSGALAIPTSYRSLLFGTAGYKALAALTGEPAPDYDISDNFFSTGGDRLQYTPYDNHVWPAVPTDGVNSLHRIGMLSPTFTTGVNTPENYNGDMGSVVAPGPSPPAVPDGTVGSMPMTVLANNQNGSSLTVSWDTATCGTATDHQILFGQGSQLPAAPGGVFGLTGSVCGLGAASAFLWNPSPVAIDGTGLIWWVIVVNDGANAESSWGKDSTLAERNGPGPVGSSAQCGVTTKDLANTCGQ